jgi:hypothetical protein
MPNLEQDIISTIRRKQKQNIILKQSYFLITSILSFVGIIYSGFYIADAIAVSGSFQFASLVFYDISMLSYWKEISLSIAESFPFFGFALGMSVLTIFFWSLLKNLKVIKDIRFQKTVKEKIGLFLRRCIYFYLLLLKWSLAPLTQKILMQYG